MLRFNIKNVVVLRLSKEFNEDYNATLPPVCYVQFNKTVPVTFEHDPSRACHGVAVLRRDRNRIIADIELRSDMYPPEEVLGLIQQLYPSVGFILLGWNSSDITHIQVVDLSLSLHPNQDEKVEALGDKTMFLDKGELH